MEPLGLLLTHTRGVAAPKTAARSPVPPRDWEAAVGSRIAMRAEPVKLERGVLFVRAASATWAQELSLLCEPILEQLRARGVAVRELRFRVGQVEPPERAKTREEVRTSPPSVKLPEALADDIRRVEDDALREAIARAASKNLGWQRMRASKARPGVRAYTAPTNPAPTNPEPLSDVEAATTKRAARAPRPAARGSDPQDRAEARASASRPRTRGST